MVRRKVLVKNILGSLEDRNSRKVSKVVAEFLLRSKRTHELPSIMRDLKLARYEQDKTVEVTAASAAPLLAKHEAEVKKTLRQFYPDARKVIVTNKIDETLIGGIRLEFPDRQLDMSVEARITKLRGLIS